MGRKPKAKVGVEEKKGMAAPDSKQNEVPANDTQEQPQKAAETQKAEDAVALVDALLMYQNDTTINVHLVNNGLDEEQKKCVAILDKAMCPLSDMELNRLVLKDVLEGYMKQAGVKTLKELEGKVIENVPYMSVTMKPLKEILQARYDLGLDKPNCIVVHTKNEGKVKGIDVCVELREAGYAVSERMKQQQEIILARNQKFLVKKVVFGDEWGEAYPVLHFYAI